MDGSIDSIIIVIALVLAVGLVVVAIFMSARADENDARQKKLRREQRAELRSLIAECDGRSLVMTKPLGWTGSDDIALRVSARIIQVFHLSTPGYEVKMYVHDPLEDSIFMKEKTVSVKTLLEGPFTLRPQIGRMLTAEEVQAMLLPRVAAKRSYNQADIDATVTTLADHRITYTLTRGTDLTPIIETEPVVYRPKSHDTNVTLEGVSDE